MNRRNILMMSAAGVLGTGGGEAAQAQPIQLHVDLTVDPAKEQELAANFRKTFRPTISKQPGFVDVKLLKLRNAMKGKAPEGVNYRLLISFQTEEQRQKWVATDEHQKAWPTIEKTLKDYTVVLFDSIG